MAERLRTVGVALALVLALGGCTANKSVTVERAAATPTGQLKDQGMAIARGLHDTLLADIGPAVEQARGKAAVIPNPGIAARTQRLIDTELAQAVDLGENPLSGSSSPDYNKSQSGRLDNAVALIQDQKVRDTTTKDLDLAEARAAMGGSGQEENPESVVFLISRIGDAALVDLVKKAGSDDITVSNAAGVEFYRMERQSDEDLYGLAAQAYDQLYAGSATQVASINSQLTQFEEAVRNDG